MRSALTLISNALTLVLTVQRVQKIVRAPPLRKSPTHPALPRCALTAQNVMLIPAAALMSSQTWFLQSLNPWYRLSKILSVSQTRRKSSSRRNPNRFQLNLSKLSLKPARHLSSKYLSKKRLSRKNPSKKLIPSLKSMILTPQPMSRPQSAVTSWRSHGTTPTT